MFLFSHILYNMSGINAFVIDTSTAGKQETDIIMVEAPQRQDSCLMVVIVLLIILTLAYWYRCSTGHKQEVHKLDREFKKFYGGY